MRHLAIAALFACTSATAGAQTGIIETIAGGGPDGLPAVQANLEDPMGVALDAAGNLYIASTNQHRVFKVDPSGLLTVFAGTGTPGFDGDGGPALQAALRSPTAVAVGAGGHVFIVDTTNNRIRRVDASTGVITTVAGTGGFGFSGDGGPATSARLQSPIALALDASGNLFVADAGNNRIRRVDAATGIITTVAGNGNFNLLGDGGPAINAGLLSPNAVAVDGGGNLFITAGGFGNNLLRRVAAATGIITTVPGLFNQLGGVIVDGGGNVYVAEVTNQRIRRVDAATGTRTTVAGGGAGDDGGPATSASLRNPWGVALDPAGNLFITQRWLEMRVRRVAATTGIITTVAGNGAVAFSGDGHLATRATLFNPIGIAVDAQRNVFVVDASNARVRRVDATTGIITTVAGNGVFAFGGDGGPASSASLEHVSGVAIDASGNLLISETRRIRRVDAVTGIITTVAGSGASGFSGDGGPATSAGIGPCNVALDADGNMFISDAGTRIRRVAHATGIITTVAGNGITVVSGPIGDGGPATSASLGGCSVALDAGGNLFIADELHDRVRRVDAATGIIRTVAGGGSLLGDGILATQASLSRPSGVAFDARGDLLIADGLRNRVRRVDAATGIITTLAGTGVLGFSGDGGPATEARLAVPTRVVVAGGGVYVSDRSNHRIRRVNVNQPPVADAGADQVLIVGEAGTFDGTGSTDTDGTIESYAWDFGDGESASGQAVQHAYAAAGAFTARLTVTDDQESTASDAAMVTVLTLAQALDLLTGLVESYNLKQGIANSLDKKLELARASLEAANAGRREDAVHKLQAFIHEAEAQRGNALTGAQADELVGWAAKILARL